MMDASDMDIVKGWHRAQIEFGESYLKDAHKYLLKKLDSMGWNTIDTAPKDGTFVDLWSKDDYRISDCQWHREFWIPLDGPFVDEEDVSHWMPLPAPPITTQS